jgi:hypothetical protein
MGLTGFDLAAEPEQSDLAADEERWADRRV